jgi:hypothetical protein
METYFILIATLVLSALCGLSNKNTEIGIDE